jgi:hypothetical protein
MLHNVVCLSSTCAFSLLYEVAWPHRWLRLARSYCRIVHVDSLNYAMPFLHSMCTWFCHYKLIAWMHVWPSGSVCFSWANYANVCWLKNQFHIIFRFKLQFYVMLCWCMYTPLDKIYFIIYIKALYIWMHYTYVVHIIHCNSVHSWMHTCIRSTNRFWRVCIWTSSQLWLR